MSESSAQPMGGDGILFFYFFLVPFIIYFYTDSMLGGIIVKKYQINKKLQEKTYIGRVSLQEEVMQIETP